MHGEKCDGCNFAGQFDNCGLFYAAKGARRRRGTPTERIEEEATATTKPVTETGGRGKTEDNCVGIAAGASTSQETSVQPVARNVRNAGSRTILPRSAVWVQRRLQATLAREPAVRSRLTTRAETRSSARLKHNHS